MEKQTRYQVTVQSSPACSPQYFMIIPAGTEVEHVDGKPVVARAGFHRVRGGNSHDREHYYIWLPEHAFELD